MSNICNLMQCPLYDQSTNVCEDDKLYLNRNTGQTECRYCTQAKLIYKHEEHKDMILDKIKNNIIHKDTIKYYVIEISDRYNVTSVNLDKYLIASGMVKSDKFYEVLNGMNYVGKLILNEEEFLGIVINNECNKEKLRKCR